MNTALATREHLLTVVTTHRASDTTIELTAETVAHGGKATVVVLLDNETRQDFRDFARAEDLDDATGEGIARERLADFYRSRIGDNAHLILADASSSGGLLEAVQTSHATGIAIPQELATRADLRRFVAGAPVPVTIVPANTIPAATIAA